MCTLVILRRPDHAWPILIAANRDEMLSRPWRPPARHWPDAPDIVAGLDELAGGSWLGTNQTGVVAGILNRPGSLGPAGDKKSRGELVIDALRRPTARAAADEIVRRAAGDYRPFNMVIADRADAYWLRNLGGDVDGGPGAGEIERFDIPPGLAMLTAHDLNDETAARIALYLPRFRAARVPDPAAGDWAAWTALLASRDGGGHGLQHAMAIVGASGFGTGSSSLLGLPRDPDTAPVWLFAAGLPGSTPYLPVEP